MLRPPLTACPLFFGVTMRRCVLWLSRFMGVKGSRASQERAHLGPGGNVVHLVTRHSRGSSRLSIRPRLAGTEVPLLGGREQGCILLPSATSVGLRRLDFLSACTRSELCAQRPPACAHARTPSFLTRSPAGGHTPLYQTATWLPRDWGHARRLPCVPHQGANPPNTRLAHTPGTCLP